MEDLSKKKEIYGSKTYYRGVGYYLLKFEMFHQAIKYFNQAIQKTPDDIKALLGRAKGSSKISHYKEALDDLKTALNLRPDDLIVLANKSLNTFLACEFEEALIQNNRLLKIRMKPDHFYVGALHCADAIENCLGERTGHPLRDHYLIIRALAWKKNYEEQHPPERDRKGKKKKTIKVNIMQEVEAEKDDKKISIYKFEETDLIEKKEDDKSILTNDDLDDEGHDDDVSLTDTVYSVKTEYNILPPKTDFKYKPLQNYTSNIENYMASTYLDVLFDDKKYLKNFFALPGINIPDVNSSQKLLQLSKSAYKTVCYKQELLRTRRPFYFIKYQQVTLSGALKRRQEEQLLKIQRAETAKAASLLQKLRQVVKDGNICSVVVQAEKLKQFCDSKQKTALPNRDYFLSQVYKNSCQAFYDLLKITKVHPQRMEKRLKLLLGMEIKGGGSKDSLAEFFQEQHVDWKKLINIYTKRLKSSTNIEESAWLYHELSRFHTEMKQYEIARIYARKCIKASTTLKQPKWEINALFLIIKINLKEKKKNDAKIEIMNAMKTAKKIRDDDLNLFLHRIRDVVEKADYGEVFGMKEIEKREQEIMGIMEGDMKSEAADLFRKMKALPASRKMSILPGFRYQETTEEKEKKTRSILSIDPAHRASVASMYDIKKVRPSGPRILFSETPAD